MLVQVSKFGRTPYDIECQMVKKLFIIASHTLIINYLAIIFSHTITKHNHRYIIFSYLYFSFPYFYCSLFYAHYSVPYNLHYALSYFYYRLFYIHSLFLYMLIILSHPYYCLALASNSDALEYATRHNNNLSICRSLLCSHDLMTYIMTKCV